VRDYCELIDHCDLWLELPTPELAGARPHAFGGAAAFLARRRFCGFKTGD
jgi:hypothetical protein